VDWENIKYFPLLAKNKCTIDQPESDPLFLQIGQQTFSIWTFPMGLAKDIHFFQAIKKAVGWRD